MERLHPAHTLENVRESSQPHFEVEYRSPVGPMTLTATETYLTRVQWGTRNEAKAAIKNDLLCEAISQLDSYFDGRRRTFDLPLKPSGTPFQLRVWDELKQIPFGEVITYAEQARRIGAPNACRAVGAANGRNPLSLFVPCHRVIGTNRKLTGFAGGLSAKARLLELERAVIGFTSEKSPRNHLPQIEWTDL